jgi:hypothetical protein
MFDSRFARSLIALGVAAGPLLAEAAPVAPSTPPTPAPCTADGHCTPNREVWGYTQPKWRRWPGVGDQDQVPGGEAGAPRLPASDPPSKELEDQTAPPPVEAIEPRPREMDEPEDDTRRDGFAPGRPGEQDLPPRVPDDERAPRNGLAPPPDDMPDFLRGNPGVPGINQPFVPPGGAPPQFGPGLGQPPVEQAPLGQPPTAPTEPTLREPTGPAGGAGNPDEDFFPDFRSGSKSDDAPPALPFRLARGAEASGWSPVSGVRGAVSPATTNIPQPTAPAASGRTSSTVAPGGDRKVDSQVQRTSFDQDSPPTLPAFLQ